MPPKNEPAAPAQPARPAEPAAAGRTVATPPDDPAVTEATAAADAATGPDETTEEAPLNRAERRARGKGTGSPQPTSRGKVVGGKGPASSQRMWANRRSG